jgi:hypothetical protein
MARIASISVFALIVAHAVAAQAQQTDEGWFEEQAETDQTEAETVGQPQPAAEAEAEAEAAEEAAEAEAEKTEDKAAKPGKVIVVSDPVKDEPAEKPRRPRGARLHDGFYLRMSVGGGSLAARGDRYDAGGAASDYSFTGNALHFDIAVGGTPTPGLVLGGTYLGSYGARGARGRMDGADTTGDTGMSFSLIGPFLDVYPEPRGGFHVGGMLGLAGTASHDDR